MGDPVSAFPLWVQKRYRDLVGGKKATKDWSKDANNSGQALLAGHLQLAHLKAGIPQPRRDYGKLKVDGAPWRELLGRNWQADFCWPDQKLAVFVDGIVHKIESKRAADCERDNVLHLAFPDWTFFRFTKGQVVSLVAVDSIVAFLKWATSPDDEYYELTGQPYATRAERHHHRWVLGATLSALQKRHKMRKGTR